MSWNGWILSEAVGGGDKNDDKNDGILVKELAAACQGIYVTSTHKCIGLWLGIITIKT